MSITKRLCSSGFDGFEDLNEKRRRNSVQLLLLVMLAASSIVFVWASLGSFQMAIPHGATAILLTQWPRFPMRYVVPKPGASTIKSSILTVVDVLQNATPHDGLFFE